MRKRILFFLLFVITSHLYAKSPPAAAIASANKYASQAGKAVLAQGGNAFDAAIAVASTLAVAEPYNSGLGGGGFWLIYSAKQKKYLFIDAREVAPLKATVDMYIKDPQRAVDGALAAGIPGEVAGMVYLSQHYANLTLAQDLAPAIALAKSGFKVSPMYRARAEFHLPVLQQYPKTSHIFLTNNQVPQLGDILKQPELANTLQQIARTGGQDFYRGKTAHMMVSAVDAQGGIWQLQDLARYHVKVRKPLMATYQNAVIITAPPPSAGGIALLTMLNLIEDSHFFDKDDLMKKHDMLEFMRNIFFDRYRYLGDPKFVSIPIKYLTSQEHAKRILSRIYQNHATPSSQLATPVTTQIEGQHTTHYSIIDKQGNIVAATLSLNYSFGSGFVAGNTGVLLNDQMDDFGVSVNRQNVYGLLGGKNNLIAPGKRPVSSMTPTIIVTPDKTIVLGTPGGSKIVTMMMLATVAALSGDTAEEIVTLPRYHMQYYPDEVSYEKDAFTQQEINALKNMGYQLTQVDNPYGNMQVVIWNKKRDVMDAASDPRGEG